MVLSLQFSWFLLRLKTMNPLSKFSFFGEWTIQMGYFYRKKRSCCNCLDLLLIQTGKKVLIFQGGIPVVFQVITFVSTIHYSTQDLPRSCENGSNTRQIRGWYERGITRNGKIWTNEGIF